MNESIFWQSGKNPELRTHNSKLCIDRFQPRESVIILCAPRRVACGGLMTWNYSQKTTDLFMAAVQGKPGTHLGEIEDADGFGEHGSISCGDAG
jgi:hypothetical protein